MRRLLAVAGAAMLVTVSVMFAGGTKTASAAPMVTDGLSPCSSLIINPISPIKGLICPPDTATSPTPHMPVSGTTSQLDPTPEQGSSLYEVYGYGPLHWDLFDSVSAVKHPTELGSILSTETDNTIGSWLLGSAVDITALVNGLTHLVDPPTFLKSLNRLITTGSNTLYRVVWKQYIGLALIVLAVMIAWSARKQNLAAAIQSAGWAIGVIGLVTFISLYPVAIGTAVDNAIPQITDSITGSFNDVTGSSGPGAAGSLIVQDVLYPEWLEGELGSSTSDLAVSEGPKLYDANGYSWAQTGGDGSKPPSSSVVSSKLKEWSKAAGVVKAEDPSAYTYLTDSANGRISAGFVALVAVLLTVPFRLVSLFLVLAAMLVLIFGVMVFPLVGVLGVNERFSGPLRRLFQMVGSAILSSVVFSVLAALDVLVNGTLLSPATGIPMIFRVVICGLFTAVLWAYSQPFRRLFALAGVVSSKSSRVVRHARKFNKARDIAAAGAAGGVAAVATEMVVQHFHHRERDEAIPAQPREETMPAIEDDNPLTPGAPAPEADEPVAVPQTASVDDNQLAGVHQLWAIDDIPDRDTADVDDNGLTGVAGG